MDFTCKIDQRLKAAYISLSRNNKSTAKKSVPSKSYASHVKNENTLFPLPPSLSPSASLPPSLC